MDRLTRNEVNGDRKHFKGSKNTTMIVNKFPVVQNIMKRYFHKAYWVTADPKFKNRLLESKLAYNWLS